MLLLHNQRQSLNYEYANIVYLKNLNAGNDRFSTSMKSPFLAEVPSLNPILCCDLHKRPLVEPALSEIGDA